MSPTGELSEAISKPITVCGSLSSIDPGKAPVIVRVYTLPSGVALTKELILGDSTGQSSPKSYKQVLARVAPPLNASYCLSLPSGSDVYVFAFADVDRDWKLDAATEPLGWLRAEPSAPPLRVKVGTNSNGNVQELPPIALHALTPFRSTSTANGKLEPSADGRYWHMKLHGSGPQRAQAHGFLAAKQIVDFFRFFILESVVKSASRYAKVVAPGFNSTFAQYSDPEYMAEANALLQGMSKRAAEAGSGKALLMVPELGRPFSYEDLFAINAYDAFGHGVPARSLLRGVARRLTAGRSQRGTWMVRLMCVTRQSPMPCYSRTPSSRMIKRSHLYRSCGLDTLDPSLCLPRMVSTA